MTTHLSTLKSVLRENKPPARAVLFDSWLIMHGAGVHVADAEPSSDDPLLRKNKPLTRKDIARALVKKHTTDLLSVPGLASIMFADVDGSLTQTLLKLMADVESVAARSRIKSTYVKWLLTNGKLMDVQRVSEVGASDKSMAEALTWLRSDQGKEARRVCLRLGKLIDKGGKIDYMKLTSGTHIAPFDLRYLVAAAANV